MHQPRHTRPTGWPPGAPAPGEARFAGWARHRVVSCSPLWLTRAVVQHRVGLRHSARLAWRYLAAETAALSRSAAPGGGLRQALADAGVAEDAAADVLAAVEADLARRRRTLGELGDLGPYL